MIPSYKEMMFSILRFIGERGSVDRKEVCKFVAEHYKFSDDELSQRIPSRILQEIKKSSIYPAPKSRSKKPAEACTR